YPTHYKQAPLAIRKYALRSAWTPHRNNVLIELCTRNNDDSDGRSYGRRAGASVQPLYRFLPRYNPQALDELKKLGEPEFMRRKGDLARSWIAERPARFLYLVLRRFQLFYFPGPDAFGTKGGRAI